jgi:Rps23 Pro-64 3,4-dihydroxylase Tpa1-like proline 4-hydroxylase
MQDLKHPKLFSWQAGRNGGYKKFPFIYSRKFRLDAYFLKFSKGAHILPHTDNTGYHLKHYRFNIIFWNARKGGEFKADGKLKFNWKNRIIFFRADKVMHEVTPVIEGNRYALSFGKGIIK